MRKITGPIAMAAAGLLAVACSRKAEKTEPPAKAQEPQAAAKTAEPPAAGGEAPTSTVPAGTALPGTLPRSPTPTAKEPEKVANVSVALRPMDAQILALAKQNADEKAVRKAFSQAPGKTPRVELKARGGEKIVEVEVDLDGDERVDERWRVEPSGAAVRTARVRDDSRDDVFKLEGDRWKLVSGSGKSATQEVPAPVPLRPVDKEILARAGKPGKPSDDATPGEPYRVALSAEQGSAKLNRVKLDLDRDGKWDETWWVELPIVRRSVSPKDNGDQSQRFRLVDGKWIQQ